jgi:hypothetical protein
MVGRLSGSAWVYAGLAAAIAGCAVVLGAYSYDGTFTRFIADDYCTTAKLHELGYWGLQRYFYTTQNGRYSFVFLDGLAELLPTSALTLQAGTAILLWFAFLFAACKRILDLAGATRSRFASLPLSLFVIGGTLSTAPEVTNSLYWKSGFFTYLPPLILFPLLVSLILHAKQVRTSTRFWGLTILIAILAIVAGGFSETDLALQAGGIVLWILICEFILRERRAVVPLASALAGSLAALVVFLVSPGNAIRSTLFGPSVSPALKVVLTLAHSVRFVSQTLAADWITLLLILVASALVAVVAHRGVALPEPSLHLWIRITLGMSACLVVSTIVPSMVAMSGHPPLRALVVPAHVVTLCAVACGYLIGLWSMSWEQITSKQLALASALAIVLAILGPAREAARYLALIPQLRAHAAAFDAQDARLRAARRQGATTANVIALGFYGRLTSLHAKPSWVTGCVAEYYGFDSIMVEDSQEGDFPKKEAFPPWLKRLDRQVVDLVNAKTRR